ncbi:MAG: GAF domain-containing protein [Vicinamibacteria bacterium]|nr:GAF domain-containing protein [Vicinamibacteria bacterium]
MVETPDVVSFGPIRRLFAVILSPLSEMASRVPLKRGANRRYRAHDSESAPAPRDVEISILAGVAARIQDEQDVDAVFGVVLEGIVARMPGVSVWVAVRDGPVPRVAARMNVPEARLNALARHAAEVCSSCASHEQRASPCRIPSAAWLGGHHQLCYPLAFEAGGQAWLNVARATEEAFSAEERRFVETLSRLAFLAVERARHRRAERVRDQETRAIASITKAIGGSLDVEAVLAAVGNTARELVGVDRVQIYLGSGSRHLKVAYLGGLQHPELTVGQALDPVQLGATMLKTATESRELLRVDDWETDERVNGKLARRWGLASALVAPLLARSRLLGLLVLTRMDPCRWSTEQIDLTEALAAQASVALEHARLYEDLRRAYDELKSAQQRIIQTEKMAVAGTFASGLAHEVRNPLNSIGLQLSLLERRFSALAPALIAEMQELTGIIREEIRRLDALVGDFLLFSRTNRLHFRAMSLDALVDDVIRLLRPEGRASNVTFKRIRGGESPPKIPMDDERIKQVLINLLRNAIEAMPDGGQVTVEVGWADGQARVVVRDNGPGLPEGLDVFQFFVSTKSHGTGLGLPIAQQVVLDHGGEISVVSRPGSGATFTVILPLQAEGAPEASNAAGGAPSP